MIILAMAFFLGACGNIPEKSVSNENPINTVESEIRAVLCQIENGNYADARSRLEAVLQKEPQNIFAARLLPGVLSHQIKKDDKSPENIAQIKKTIEAFEQALKNPQFSDREKMSAGYFIPDLYGMLGEEEKNAALLKMAEDPGLTPQNRSSFYTRLATDKYVCANDISDDETVKKIAKKDGEDVYVFTKPGRAEDFEMLTQCTAEGLELIDKALELDQTSDTAWSYKASLLNQKMRIAEMEGRNDEKERLKKEADVAREKFTAAMQNKENQNSADEPADPAAGLKDPPTPDINEMLEELTSYKIERPLEKMVSEIYIPIDYLISPIPEDTELPAEIEKREKPKREWKTFSPNGELSAELPDNAAPAVRSDKSVLYEADNGDTGFLIHAQPRPDFQNTELDDKVLNTLAWTMVKSTGNLFVKDEWGGLYEINLVGKDPVSGRPARLYAYTVSSCKDKKDGLMLVIIGPKYNYAIDIRGAGEKDEASRRFFDSLKING